MESTWSSLERLTSHPSRPRGRNAACRESQASYCKLRQAATCSPVRPGVGLVFASSGEGFGLPVLEALSHGTPVVASNKTSIPEVGGDFALYFDPDGPDAEPRLASLADEVIRDPPSIDEQALSRHLAQFNWQESAATLLAAVAGME